MRWILPILGGCSPSCPPLPTLMGIYGVGYDGRDGVAYGNGYLLIVVIVKVVTVHIHSFLLGQIYKKTSLKFGRKLETN